MSRVMYICVCVNVYIYIHMHNNLHIKISCIKFNSVPYRAHLPLSLLVGTSAVCSHDEGERFPGVGLQWTQDHILTMSCMNNQLKDVINHDGLEAMGIYRHNYVDICWLCCGWKSTNLSSLHDACDAWSSGIFGSLTQGDGPGRSKLKPQYILLPSILLDLLQPFGLFGEEAP